MSTPARKCDELPCDAPILLLASCDGRKLLDDQVLLLDAQDQHGDAAAAHDECSTAALATISLHTSLTRRCDDKAASVPPAIGYAATTEAEKELLEKELVDEEPSAEPRDTN